MRNETMAAANIIGILPPNLLPSFPPTIIPNVSIELKIAPLTKMLPV